MEHFKRHEHEGTRGEEFVRQLLDWLDTFRATIHNIFIFSLSEEPSLLSQWRSYTPHGQGVSLWFSPEKVKEWMAGHGLKLAKCLYQSHEHSQALGRLIDKLLITFCQEKDTIDKTGVNPSQCYYPFLERFRNVALQVLCIIKHRGFEEEQEWRLISPYFSQYTTPKNTAPEIKFREGVPYVELELGTKPYFQKVILGPSAEQDLSHHALSMFLSNTQICNRTENCDIPYREWR